MDTWNVTGGSDGKVGHSDVHSLPEIKSRIHRKLLGRLNLANLESVSREEATRAIKTAIQEILVDDQAALNVKEREILQVARELSRALQESGRDQEVLLAPLFGSLSLKRQTKRSGPGRSCSERWSAQASPTSA